MAAKPRARDKDLIVEHFDSEALIYDLRTDTAACLNGWTTRLWSLADGTRDLTDLAIAMNCEVALVQTGLDKLADQGLIDGEADKALIRRATAPELTRRQVIERIGGAARLAAVAAPGVVAIMVPTPVRAASAGCNPGDWSAGALNSGVVSNAIGAPVVDASCDGGSPTQQLQFVVGGSYSCPPNANYANQEMLYFQFSPTTVRCYNGP